MDADFQNDIYDDLAQRLDHLITNKLIYFERDILGEIKEWTQNYFAEVNHTHSDVAEIHNNEAESISVVIGLEEEVKFLKDEIRRLEGLLLDDNALREFISRSDNIPFDIPTFDYGDPPRIEIFEEE